MKRLAELRKQKKLSQKGLAQHLNVAQNTISQWEKGERDPDTGTLARLASFFGVSTDYLLGITDDPTATVEPKQEQKKPKDLQKFLDQQQIMFDGVPLTEDDKEKIRKALELIFWDAKQKNKRKKS